MSLDSEGLPRCSVQQNGANKGSTPYSVIKMILMNHHAYILNGCSVYSMKGDE